MELTAEQLTHRREAQRGPGLTQDRSLLPRRNLASREALRSTPLEKRATGLGWFSIGLGLAQLCAPRRVAELIGVDAEDENARLGMMAVGLRELTCGIGLLSGTNPALWAWARAAGDVMDLALLGYSWRDSDASTEQMLGAAGAVLGCAILDAETAVELSRERPRQQTAGIHVRQSITVQKSPQEAYAFFRQLENLPTFMAHLESVKGSMNGRSRWRARAPLGMHVEWEAEVIDDRPGESIAWRSIPGADVPNQGSVSFRPAPGDLGTEISVELDYRPPAGDIGRALAKLFGQEPSQAISADLRRLKQVLETGEVLHSDASIHRGMHPARPSRATSTHHEQVNS